MKTGKGISHFLVLLGVILLQFVMTQGADFIVTLIFPGLEVYPQEAPSLFITVTGISYTLGVFLIGLAALKLHWLTMAPKYSARLAFVLIGAFVPLLIALYTYPRLEPGNPFYFIAMFTTVFGFYVPDLQLSKQTPR